MWMDASQYYKRVKLRPIFRLRHYTKRNEAKTQISMKLGSDAFSSRDDSWSAGLQLFRE